MKTIKIFGRNREEIERQARNKSGENYFIISIKELHKRCLFGSIKRHFEVSIGVLENF